MAPSCATWIRSARQLERSLPRAQPIERTVDGRGGVIDRLRKRPKELPIRGEADIVKHRFYVWRDAEVLLRADPALFGQLVDALTGVAAEAEYASDDRLLIHRAGVHRRAGAGCLRGNARWAVPAVAVGS